MTGKVVPARLTPEALEELQKQDTWAKAEAKKQGIKIFPYRLLLQRRPTTAVEVEQELKRDLGRADRSLFHCWIEPGDYAERRNTTGVSLNWLPVVPVRVWYCEIAWP